MPSYLTLHLNIGQGRKATKRIKNANMGIVRNKSCKWWVSWASANKYIRVYDFNSSDLQR